MDSIHPDIDLASGKIYEIPGGAKKLGPSFPIHVVVGERSQNALPRDTPTYDARSTEHGARSMQMRT